MPPRSNLAISEQAASTAAGAAAADTTIIAAASQPGEVPAAAALAAQAPGADLAADLERAFRTTVVSADGTVPLRDREQLWPGSYTAPAPLGSLQPGIARGVPGHSEADEHETLPLPSSASDSRRGVAPNGGAGGVSSPLANGNGHSATAAAGGSGHITPDETGSAASNSGTNTPQQQRTPRTQSPNVLDRRNSAGIRVPSPKFTIPAPSVLPRAGGHAGSGGPSGLGGRNQSQGPAVPFLDVTADSWSTGARPGGFSGPGNAWDNDYDSTTELWPQVTMGSGQHGGGAGSGTSSLNSSLSGSTVSGAARRGGGAGRGRGFPSRGGGGRR